jgi:hypothetical protein
MAKKKSRIPRFRTDEEERQFWSQHSFEEFADELKELNVNISPPSQAYAKGRKTAAALLKALPSLSLEEETLNHIESQVKARRKHPARIPRF